MDSVLPQLLSPMPQVVQKGVEEIMNEVQVYQEQLVGALIADPRCKQYLAVLCNLLMSSDIRLCSNVAYILGTVAEDPAVCTLLVELARSSTDWDLRGRLGAMLLWEDTEAVMNAAGALGTLAETSEGRRWILASPDSILIIQNVSELLGSPSDWTASNCALVLARISMCQEGCARLLGHPKSDDILRKLIASLHDDEAGCGLNAAFALGRLCDTGVGRKRVLGLQEAEDMVSALDGMMSGADAGGSQNACFALTCLATDPAGHRHVLKSPSFPRILDTLCRLLQSEEQESCWFAAMTVTVLSSYSQGVLRLRQHQSLEDTLKRVAASHTAGKELLDEVHKTLGNLQRLPQLPCPKTKVVETGSIWVTWEEHSPKSSLPITYSLLDGERLLYQGKSCSLLLSDCKPGQQYHLKVIMETIGDRSPESSETVVSVDKPLPGCPLNLQVTGRTATKVKLGWSPPAENGATIKCYVVYREDVLVETTTELSCIVCGLAPSSSYNFSVCACSSSGQGQRALLVAKTMDKGDHAPGKLTLYVVGRSEIFITWEVPRDPLGRFFNYELCMNGKPVYLGTERSFTARRLTPSTEYTCTVCAITSEGRFESRPVTKRTAKDEYSNLNKNHMSTESHQPATSSPTHDTEDPPERQQKMDAPAKHCPSKNRPIRLLMSRQNSQSRDSKIQPTNSRRGSQISWSTESSEDYTGTLAPDAQTQRVPPGDPRARPTDEKHRKGSFCHGEPATSKENRGDIALTMNPRVTPKLSKQIPGRALDPTCPRQAQLESRKPQSAHGLIHMPVASLLSLAPEYPQQQRAKTELVKPMQWGKRDRHGAENFRESDKDNTLCRRKILQPVRDPLLRFRCRNLIPGDLTEALRSPEGKMGTSYGKCPAICTEDEKVHLSPMYKDSLRKNIRCAKPDGLLEMKYQTVPQFHSELSRIHSFQKIERKVRKPLKAQRMGESLVDYYKKDILALVGQSGVMFRLPLASQDALTPQRVSAHSR
ncbi:uncharacterized protein RCH25_004797 [Pelodytes ibericus]